jgi:hypothetical protein
MLSRRFGSIVVSWSAVCFHAVVRRRVYVVVQSDRTIKRRTCYFRLRCIKVRALEII